MGTLQTADRIFHRPDLAERLARVVLDDSPTSASPSGVFLSAPRRTGKTTFLRQDLIPALTGAGALVVYVDLWSDRAADPGKVIVAAVKATLSAHAPAVKRLAEKVGIKGGKVAGIEFSVDKIGVGDGATLVDMFVALSDTTKQLIVLLIDEAQHASTSSAGADALFALKAARDELNSNPHFGLRVVCTGSNQDKLAMLRSSKDQAFFGAPLVPFPALGNDFIDWFCANTKGLPGPLLPQTVAPLFRRAGNRPEMLGAAVDALRFDFELSADRVQARFNEAVETQIHDVNQDLLRTIHSLTPIQAAVFKVMAASGTDFAPFEAATLERYQRVMRSSGDKEHRQMQITNVQQSLTALQEKGLAWRAARGVYAIDDPLTVDVMRRHGLLTEGC
ncbi:MAG: ATP-binding protein [Rhizobacter sp.]|nr:ATP-binding protein [Burkholderiales bacterium]